MKFQKTVDESGRISGLELGGLLVLENSQNLKNEFIGAAASLSDSLNITISELEEIDISCIQLFISFLKKLDEMKVKYELDWNIDKEQMQLLENLGLNSDFFLNN